MKNRIHPYALIFGIAIGIVVLAALRHPLFALFAGVAAVVLLDMGFKGRAADKSDKDK